MKDEEWNEYAQDVRRDEGGGAVIATIAIVAIASATIGCSLAWVLIKVLGW